MPDVPFQSISRDAIPNDWKMPPSADWWRQTIRELGVGSQADLDSEVCLELPDFPVAHAYQQWTSSLPADALQVTTVVSSRAAWADRQFLCAQVLRELLGAGRPHPVWIRIAYKKQR